MQTGPPSWRQRTIDPARTLSWVSPSCAPSGRVLAAAAGPSNAGDAGFGGEHRSIWLLRPDGHPIRRLTDPPAPGLSDEAPRFSRDGHWILFVRIRNHLPNPVTGPSFSEDTIKLTRASGTGRAIPIADFTSDDVSYYDHFDWPTGSPGTSLSQARGRNGLDARRLTCANRRRAGLRKDHARHAPAGVRTQAGPASAWLCCGHGPPC